MYSGVSVYVLSLDRIATVNKCLGLSHSQFKQFFCTGSKSHFWIERMADLDFVFSVNFFFSVKSMKSAEMIATFVQKSMLIQWLHLKIYDNIWLNKS